jgi:hypothetical protein
MYAFQREMPVDEAQLPRVTGEKLLEGGGGLLAGRALEIAVLEDHDRRLRRAAHMVCVADRGD